MIYYYRTTKKNLGINKTKGETNYGRKEKQQPGWKIPDETFAKISSASYSNVNLLVSVFLKCTNTEDKIHEIVIEDWKLQLVELTVEPDLRFKNVVIIDNLNFVSTIFSLHVTVYLWTSKISSQITHLWATLLYIWET